MGFYQQKDIKLFMFPETSTYLTPLNGTIEVANPATYPWYSRVNLIPEGADIELPIRKREKRWGVGSGKHPSHVINTVNEPIDITLEMEMQDARFLALATGATSSAGLQKPVQVITPSTWTLANVDGAYFLMYVVDASGHQKCYAVYMDVDSDQGGAPSITGATNVNIDFAAADNLTGVNVTNIATLLDEMELALEALTEITTVTTTDTVLTVTTVANTGSICRSRNGASSAGFTFTYTTEGASTHTVTEGTGSALPSCGLHFEVNNSTEYIAVDLFGCTVINEEVVIDYEEGTIRENVTLRCPFFIVGNISTCPPPKRTIEPALWQQVSDTGTTRIIMLGSSDKTPSQVSTITFGIENEVEIYPDVGVVYRKKVIAGKRNVTMNIVGLSEDKELYTIYATDTWDNINEQYTTAAAKLNTEITVTQTATYQYWALSIYNWLITSFALKIFSPEEAVMGVDIDFEGATPDSSFHLIDSLVIKDYIAKIYYNVANA